MTLQSSRTVPDKPHRQTEMKMLERLNRAASDEASVIGHTVETYERDEINAGKCRDDCGVSDSGSGSRAYGRRHWRETI